MKPKFIRFFGMVTISLAGCSSNGQHRLASEPIVRIVEVPVPVASACVPATLGEAPNYPDTDAALKSAADAAERYLLLGAGRPLRIARLRELEIVANACPKALLK